jgi:hypothetical protein
MVDTNVSRMSHLVPQVGDHVFVATFADSLRVKGGRIPGLTEREEGIRWCTARHTLDEQIVPPPCIEPPRVYADRDVEEESGTPLTGEAGQLLFHLPLAIQVVSGYILPPRLRFTTPAPPIRALGFNTRPKTRVFHRMGMKLQISIVRPPLLRPRPVEKVAGEPVQHPALDRHGRRIVHDFGRPQPRDACIRRLPESSRRRALPPLGRLFGSGIELVPEEPTDRPVRGRLERDIEIGGKERQGSDHFTARFPDPFLQPPELNKITRPPITIAAECVDRGEDAPWLTLHGDRCPTAAWCRNEKSFGLKGAAGHP